MQKRWLTVAEAAVYLTVHPKTVYSYCSRGAIPAARIAGSVRVDRVKLDEILESRTLLISEEVEALKERSGW